MGNSQTYNNNQRKNDPLARDAFAVAGGVALGIGLSAAIAVLYETFKEDEPQPQSEEVIQKISRENQASSNESNTQHHENRQDRQGQTPVVDLAEICPPSFLCPISQEIMTDPVLLIESGMVYEREFIEDWLKDHSTDPMTNKQLTSKDLAPVLALKNAIQEWREEQEKLNAKLR